MKPDKVLKKFDQTCNTDGSGDNKVYCCSKCALRYNNSENPFR